MAITILHVDGIIAAESKWRKNEGRNKVAEEEIWG